MQTNFFSALFANNSVASANSDVSVDEIAPVELDLASLELVGGGFGPAGTWASAVVSGPAGTW